jgi:tRNA(Ile)-lysidine synthase
MWARRERYACFEASALASGADWILTAHHRDDLVETVFQRLGRGTGPVGLQGIPFRRGRIVRPFLDRGRAEILAYLAALGAEWREDPSNADVSIDRNWYRHRYLPALREAEPELDARIAGMALILQAIQSRKRGLDALEAEAALLHADGAGRAWLDRDAIALRIADGDTESLRYWLRELVRTQDRIAPLDAGTGPTHRLPSVTQEILKEFLRQWEKGPDTLQVPVGPGLALKCEKRGIRCAATVSSRSSARRLAKKGCPPPAQRVILEKGSAHAVWEWEGRRYSLAARSYPRPAGMEFPTAMEERAIFDANLFSCTLQVRSRKDGDRFSPLGLHSRSRKLKTFLNEEKVPSGMRDSLPIIVCSHGPGEAMPEGESVAWIPRHGISDFYKVRGTTSHILELVLTCENP